MSEHRPLGLAGGPGGVDDRGEFVGANGLGAVAKRCRRSLGGVPALLQEVLEARHSVPCHPLHDDEALERQAGAHALDLRQLRGRRDEGQLRLGVLEHVADLLRSRGRVDRHRHRAEAECPQIGERPFVAVLGQERDAVAAADAQRAQRQRERFHVGQRALARQRFPAARRLPQELVGAWARRDRIEKDADQRVGDHCILPGGAAKP